MNNYNLIDCEHQEKFNGKKEHNETKSNKIKRNSKILLYSVTELNNLQLKNVGNINLNNFSDKKKRSKLFINYINKYVSNKSLELIKDCGGFLMFLSDLKLEHKKLGSANFCKNRFCPMCSWRKSKKDALTISILMNYIKDKYNKEFIFLTLTAPNVKGDKLEENIKKYNKSFKNLMRLKEIEVATHGHIRKLEVTYNEDRDDYHPHFHCVIAVNSSYFTASKYISKKRWLELWKNCMNDNTITQVDIKKAKMDDYNSIYELAKYSAKDSDYLINSEVFKSFYESLKGKRLIVYGGLFKEAMALFKAGDLDSYKIKDNIEYFWALIYKWQTNKYEDYLQRELTESEKEKFN